MKNADDQLDHRRDCQRSPITSAPRQIGGRNFVVHR
jgi:hypothetical protein